MKLIKLTASLFFIFILTTSSAQNTIGVKGGYTNAWPGYGDIEFPEEAETNVEGLNISIFYNKDIYKGWSVSLAPGYVQRGANCVPGWNGEGGWFLGDTRVELEYVELPVALIKSVSLLKGRLKVSAGVGYSVNRLVRAMSYQEVINWDGEPDVIETRIEIDDENVDSFRPIDHGVFGQLSISYLIHGKYAIFIEASRFQGFADYDKQFASRNRSLNYNIGTAYTF